VIDTIPIPQPQPNIVGRTVKIRRGEYADRMGVVKEYKSSQWQVEIDLGNKKTVIEGYMIEELMVLEDEASGIAAQPNHVGSLTSAGVAGELAKPKPAVEFVSVQEIRERAERWVVPAGVSTQVKDDLLTLLRLFDDQTKENTTLTNKLTAAEVASKKADDLFNQLEAAKQARDSHLAANVKLNREKIELEQRLEEAKQPHPADVEAMRQVERERDEAREELRKSEKIVQMFAKRLKAKKTQPVEVKTLVQELAQDATGDKQQYADTVLCNFINDGWSVMNLSVSSFFDDSNRDYATVRTITLSRPVKRTNPGPKRETAVENPIPVQPPRFYAYDAVIPSTAPLNANTKLVTAEGERPLTYSEALQLRETGLISSDDLSAIGNREAGMNGLRAVLNRRRNAPLPYRPAFLPTGN
jgi:hypothetical protein